VRVAGDLFMRLGYRAVTVEMVAERAGVTKPALYYHFADKGTLLAQALIELFGRVRRMTTRLLEGPGPLPDRLVAVAERILALPEPLSRFEILMREAGDDLSPGQLAAIRAAEDAVGQTVVAAMREGAARGDLRDVDPELLGHAYRTMLLVGQMRTPEGGRRFPDHARSARALVDMLWHGVAGGDAPPATRLEERPPSPTRRGSRRKGPGA
jgi:AcrR family transcriptional regulator